jgi:hypothetical protein
VFFMITKYAVLNRKNSLMAGLRFMPIYFAVTTGILTVRISFLGVVDGGR